VLVTGAEENKADARTHWAPHGVMSLWDFMRAFDAVAYGDLFRMIGVHTEAAAQNPGHTLAHQNTMLQIASSIIEPATRICLLVGLNESRKLIQ
jgi:hypothetical protein